MLDPEQELAVQITQIDGVKVDYVHLAKPGKKEVLQQLTANSATHAQFKLRIGAMGRDMQRRCYSEGHYCKSQRFIIASV